MNYIKSGKESSELFDIMESFESLTACCSCL